jgi:hypothetical protein
MIEEVNKYLTQFMNNVFLVCRSQICPIKMRINVTLCI